MGGAEPFTVEVTSAWLISGRDTPRSDNKGCICCADGIHVFSHAVRMDNEPVGSGPIDKWDDLARRYMGHQFPEGTRFRIVVEPIAVAEGESWADGNRRRWAEVSAERENRSVAPLGVPR